MDWYTDEFFRAFLQRRKIVLTPEFQEWWINYYGKPDDYLEDENEQHEYWVRCSFALAAWDALINRQQTPLPEPPETEQA